MKATDFIAACQHPVIWYATPSQPLGVHVALLGEGEDSLPFDLTELDGSVTGDRWVAESHREGRGIDGWKLRDYTGEIIAAIQIVDNQAEWTRQKADYDSIT